MYYMYIVYLNTPMSFKRIYIGGCVEYTSCGILFHIRKSPWREV
nr:MAG TPA: GIY-YIG nuclease superfamily protein [Caudoviricetes sp.]